MSLFRKRSEATTLEELKQEWNDCKQCPFYAQRHSVVLAQGIPGKGKLYVVGQGPAGEEDKTGIPFSGAAGKLCRKLFASANIPDEEIIWSNILCCVTFKDSKVRKDWVENCWERVEAELRIFKPKAIVTLGRPAAERFCPSVANDKEAAAKKFMYEGIPGITANHPAVLLRATGREKTRWAEKVNQDMENVKVLYSKFCR